MPGLSPPVAGGGPVTICCGSQFCPVAGTVFKTAERSYGRWSVRLRLVPATLRREGESLAVRLLPEYGLAAGETAPQPDRQGDLGEDEVEGDVEER